MDSRIVRNYREVLAGRCWQCSGAELSDSGRRRFCPSCLRCFEITDEGARIIEDIPLPDELQERAMDPEQRALIMRSSTPNGTCVYADGSEVIGQGDGRMIYMHHETSWCAPQEV